jgi:hypothetical protein
LEGVEHRLKWLVAAIMIGSRIGKAKHTTTPREWGLGAG